VKWAGYGANMGEKRGKVHAVVWWGSLREGDYLKDLSIDKKIILEWILKKLVARVCSGLIWLRLGTSGRLS
jgi:GTP-dependent phosphoenolpyruvate carboxykinase